MSLVDDLTALSERRRRIVESIQGEAAAGVREILDRLLDLLDQYLSEQGDLTLGELASLNQLDDLIELIQLAGGADLEEAIKGRVAELADTLADQLAASGLSEAHTTLDEAALESYTTFKVKDVVSTFAESAAKDIQRAWIDSTFTGKPLRVAIADATAEAVKTLTEMTPQQVETHVGTAVSSIDRAITGQVGQKDESVVFIYVGPKDAIVRKSCEHIVGKWLTAEEIAKLDNGQIPGVAVTGGGWNCRHSFAPVKRKIVEARKIPHATPADIQAFNGAGARKGKKG